MSKDLKYQICKRCVMDTFDEFITFDERGFCNHCEEFLRRAQRHNYVEGVSEKKWEEILDVIKKAGRDREYDCILGISGGVDSSYTAHLCKRWGLRALLLHMDNGWDTETSVKNIKTVAEKLDFDYVSDVLDWNEFREIQLAFLKSSIVDLEMPTDIAIAASIYQTAAKHRIKYIVSGGNSSAEGILPLQMGYHVYKDMRLYHHIVKKYSTVPLKKVPTVGFLGEIYYKFIKNIRTVYPLNYIPYDKDKAREFLMESYGWENYGGNHHESKITAFWQSYAMPVKYNMDYRRTTLSSQICSRQITRGEALEKLEALSYDASKIEEDKKYIAKKYGISVQELESYLSLPPKTYLDFPNQKDLIEFIYKTYERLYRNKRI
jgi:N-acetyl sugar amidotransferase